ncbi:MAG: hypothetical protein HY876_05040 [Coriobacteriales bacterium]|nr:hypothetical protein [Coriobacteriales bacterium]
MRNVLARLLLAGLLVSLFASAGCSGGTAGTGYQTAPSDEADFAVETTVDPTSVTVNSANAKDTKVAFTVRNTGTKADTYTFSFTVFGVAWEPQGVPKIAKLQPGDLKTVSVPLSFDIQGTTPGFDLAMTATSEGEPTVKDTAVCKITFK